MTQKRALFTSAPQIRMTRCNIAKSESQRAIATSVGATPAGRDDYCFGSYTGNRKLQRHGGNEIVTVSGARAREMNAPESRQFLPARGTNSTSTAATARNAVSLLTDGDGIRFSGRNGNRRSHLESISRLRAPGNTRALCRAHTYREIRFGRIH